MRNDCPIERVRRISAVIRNLITCVLYALITATAGGDGGDGS